MAATYTIIGIVPRTRSAPGVGMIKVQEVTFTTMPSGLTGQVDVADEDFTPDKVGELVTARAATIEAVKAL